MRGLVVCGLSVASAAFVAPPSFRPAAQSTCSARGAAGDVRMIGTKEVFSQIYERSPPAQKTMQSMAPPVAQGAMAGVVAASAAVGFALTPSRRIYVNAVGGAITGLGGLLARGRIAEERTKAAEPAVAALLAEQGSAIAPDALAGISKEYGVPKKMFAEQLSGLYNAYLSACLTDAKVETTELSELQKLQKALGISHETAGNEIYKAARALYSRHRAYLEEAEDNESKQLLAKFVFLAERLLREDPSEEGYRYETTRLQRLFSMTLMDWRSVAEEAAVPIYSGVLSKSVATPGTTAQQLAAIRTKIGITDGCAEGMHTTAYTEQATALLEAGSGSLSADAQQTLSALQEMLALDAADAVLLGLTTPLYTATVGEVVAALEAGEAGAAQEAALAARQAELSLSSDAAASIEIDAMRARASELILDATAFVRVQSPEALEATQALLSFCSATTSFLATNGKAASSSAAAGGVGELFGGVGAAVGKKSEALALYRVLLLEALSDLKVDATEAEQLSTLRALLALSDAESVSVYEAAAGPLYRKAVQEATAGGELGDAAKAKLDASLADLALPAAVTAAISLEVYSAALQAEAGAPIEGAPPKILDEAQAAKLGKLRDFLGLDEDDVQPAHLSVCAPAFQKSCKELFTVTGSIPPEYWDGLKTLQARLGLSDGSADTLFAEQAKLKLKEIGDKACTALEAKAAAQQKASESGDKEGKLGIDDGALTTEVLSLVDFAQSAKILTIDGGAASVSGDMRDLFAERILKELYKQFLVEAFSSDDADQNQRLFSKLEPLALVLGLTPGEVAAIHTEIGSTIFRQYTSKALNQPGGVIGVKERQFLDSIRDTLGMDPDKCAELVRAAELTRVSMLIEAMFEASQVTAEDVRKARDTADALEVDLVEDAAIPAIKLERMFITELEAMIDDGELTVDDTSDLEDLCASLHISEELAQAKLGETVTKRCEAGVLQAACDLRESNNERAVAEMGKVLKFATMGLPGDIHVPAVSMSERQELFMLFQANAAVQGTADEEGLALLKEVVGIAA